MTKISFFKTTTKRIFLIFALHVFTSLCIGNNLFHDYLFISKLNPDTNNDFYILPKNYFYIEFCGATKFLFSVNYERIVIHKGKNYFSFRLGFNKNNLYWYNNIYAVSSFNYQKRLTRSMLIEIGFGGVYHKSVNISSYNYGYVAFNDMYYELNLGFNFIIKKRGYLRLNCNYLYWNKEFFTPWPGIGLGITF